MRENWLLVITLRITENTLFDRIKYCFTRVYYIFGHESRFLMIRGALCLTYPHLYWQVSVWCEVDGQGPGNVSSGYKCQVMSSTSRVTRLITSRSSLRWGSWCGNRYRFWSDFLMSLSDISMYVPRYCRIMEITDTYPIIMTNFIFLKVDRFRCHLVIIFFSVTITLFASRIL